MNSPRKRYACPDCHGKWYILLGRSWSLDRHYRCLKCGCRFSWVQGVAAYIELSIHNFVTKEAETRKE